MRRRLVIWMLAASALPAAAAAPASAVIHPATIVKIGSPIPGRVKVAVLLLPVRRGAPAPRLRLSGSVPGRRALVIGIARRSATSFVGVVGLAAFRGRATAGASGGVSVVATVRFTTLANGDPTVMAKPLRAQLRPLLARTFALVRAVPAAPAPGLTGRGLLQGLVGLVRGTPPAALLGALAGTAAPTPGTPTTPATPGTPTTPTTPAATVVAPGAAPGLPAFLLLQDSVTADADILKVTDPHAVPSCATSGGGGPARTANSIVQDAGDPLSALSVDDLVARFQSALGGNACLILQSFEKKYGDAVKGAVDQGTATPAGRLLQAMTRAQGVVLADGSTLASHIHFDLGPGIPSAIGAGLGPNHDLGADGKSHFNTYLTLMAAGARSAGVNLQMFHGVSYPNITPFSVVEWLRVPPAVLDVMQRAGGGAATLHFTLSAVPTMPAGALPAGFAADPMQAQFRLARQPGAALTIFANGVGALNIDPQSAQFVRELQEGYPALAG